MDKRLYILSLLALVSTSCVQSTSTPIVYQELVFSAVASHSVKSIITSTNYPLDEPFVVEAVHYPKNKSVSEPQSFMAKERVEYNFENAIWRTEDQYLWPLRGELLFYAGSPILPQVSVSSEKGVEADWSIPSGEHTQTDLCFAKTVESCESHTSVVPIVFNHALSQICFKARTEKHYSSSQKNDNLTQANVFTVVLDSVKICNILSAGHFTQEPPEWTVDPDQTSDYTVFASKEGLTLKCDRYDNPILTPVCTMLLLPQRLREDAYLEEWHHIIVRSSVTDSSTGQIVADDTYTLLKTSKLPLAKYTARWLMDMKYTFRLAVGIDDVSEITTAITDWLETKEIILGDE